MSTYEFATSHDGDKFQARGETIQAAFESLTFRASDYADDAEDLRGKRIDVWGWDENGERHDWTAHFS